jgi:hypothetical protein
MSRRRRSPDPGATQQPVQNQRGRQLQASNWYPDPVRRHQYRYWNGTAWTEHVADAGRQSSDPLTPVTPVIVAAPPEKRHLLRNAAIAVGAVALGLTAVVGAPGAGAEGPALAAPPGARDPRHDLRTRHRGRDRRVVCHPDEERGGGLRGHHRDVPRAPAGGGVLDHLRPRVRLDRRRPHPRRGVPRQLRGGRGREAHRPVVRGPPPRRGGRCGRLLAPGPVACRRLPALFRVARARA